MSILNTLINKAIAKEQQKRDQDFQREMYGQRVVDEISSKQEQRDFEQSQNEKKAASYAKGLLTFSPNSPIAKAIDAYNYSLYGAPITNAANEREGNVTANDIQGDVNKRNIANYLSAQGVTPSAELVQANTNAFRDMINARSKQSQFNALDYGTKLSLGPDPIATKYTEESKSPGITNTGAIQGQELARNADERARQNAYWQNLADEQAYYQKENLNPLQLSALSTAVDQAKEDLLTSKATSKGRMVK